MNETAFNDTARKSFADFQVPIWAPIFGADMSDAHDTCPRFVRRIYAGWQVSLWVDHIEPDNRVDRGATNRFTFMLEPLVHGEVDDTFIQELGQFEYCTEAFAFAAEIDAIVATWIQDNEGQIINCGLDPTGR